MFARYLLKHQEAMDSLSRVEATFNDAINTAVRSISRGGKLIFAGNGGSAADAQHLAAEFVGRFVEDREPIAAIAITTDSSALTCISNDYGYSDIFVRQILALGQEDDTLFCISTSGNSENLIRAAVAAKERGVSVIGLLGRDGGKIKSLCDLSLVVGSSDTASIQEAHIFLGHVLCAEVESRLEML